MGSLVVFWRDIYPTEISYYYAITAFAGMLLLNVLFPHARATLFMKKFAPGVITGVLVNLPLSIPIIKKMAILKLLSVNQIIITVIAGGVGGAVLAFLFLKVGAFLSNKFFVK